MQLWWKSWKKRSILKMQRDRRNRVRKMNGSRWLLETESISSLVVDTCLVYKGKCSSWVMLWQKMFLGNNESNQTTWFGFLLDVVWWNHNFQFLSTANIQESIENVDKLEWFSCLPSCSLIILSIHGWYTFFHFKIHFPAHQFHHDSSLLVDYHSFNC